MIKDDSIIVHNKFILDRKNKQLQEKETNIITNFSEKEIELIALLIENKGNKISKDLISQKILNQKQYVNSNAVETFIYRLKKKCKILQSLIERSNNDYRILD